MSHTISSRGLDLIQRFEGLRTHAYRDTGGVWTIGYGHTKDVTPGQIITEQQATVLLTEDIMDAEAAVNRMVKVPLEQHEFDALVSFVFNVGHGAFRSSTMLALLNEGKLLYVPRELLRWVHDNGVVLRGLVRRRLAEARLFMGEPD